MQGAATFAGVGAEKNLSRLLDRLDHLGIVERHNRAGINNLRGDAVLGFEFLGGVEGAVEGGADGENRQITADAFDVRFSEGDGVVAGGDAFFRGRVPGCRRGVGIRIR